MPVPVWFAEAERLTGLREVPGAGSNPTLLGWARRLGGFATRYYRDNATPWCGLFVGHCLAATLPDEPLPANPLSALAWGAFGLAMPQPRVGATGVFRRPGGAHTGFYAGEDEEAFHLLNGNSQDSVRLTRIAKARLVGFRWPATAPALARGVARVLAARGVLSTDEA